MPSTNNTELRRLKKQNARYRDALIYARHQSDRCNQIVGIEDATYFAWIHDECSKALRLSRTRGKTSSPNGSHEPRGEQTPK